MPNSSRSSSQRSASWSVHARSVAVDRAGVIGFGRRHGTGDQSAASSASSRASFSRSPSTTAAGALATKPSFASLPFARAISPSSSPRRWSAHAPAPPGRRASRRRARSRRRGPAATRSAPRRRPPRRGGRGAPGARRARRSPCTRRPRSAPGSACPAGRRSRCASARTAVTAAMTAPTALGLGVEAIGVGAREGRRRQQALGARDVRPDLLGHERDQGVRQGQRPPQDVEDRRGQVSVELASP